MVLWFTLGFRFAFAILLRGTACLVCDLQCCSGERRAPFVLVNCYVACGGSLLLF